jgi:hypothetical protein
LRYNLLFSEGSIGVLTLLTIVFYRFRSDASSGMPEADTWIVEADTGTAEAGSGAPHHNKHGIFETQRHKEHGELYGERRISSVAFVLTMRATQRSQRRRYVP